MYSVLAHFVDLGYPALALFLPPVTSASGLPISTALSRCPSPLPPPPLRQSTMESYVPPPSSQPPKGTFGLRLHVPSSVPHYHTPLTPISFLTRAAIIAPRKIALVHPEKGFRFTYEQWAARCLSLTFAIMATKGWKRGDRVAIIAPNTPLILEAHWAVLAAGGIDTPLK